MHPAKMPFKGAFLALLSAALFGVTTPLAKLLLIDIQPALLAGLFYLGSGAGLAVYLLIIKIKSQGVKGGSGSQIDTRWLVGAILCGGIFAPLLLLSGLAATSASTASLLLNLESVFTSLIAWFVFKENFDKRILAGMIMIVLGGLLLSWQSGQQLSISGGITLTVMACIFWAMDNNCTSKIQSIDPTQIACLKGLIAGIVNVALALSFGATWPDPGHIGAALLLGLLGYGVSLVLFIHALRHLGTARTGAYFAASPFVGTLVSLIFLGEHITAQLILAALLMIGGLWLHLTESHNHKHAHEAIEHTHSHSHDIHHQHSHDHGIAFTGGAHTHTHRHEPIVHSHAHYPDMHHHHEH